MLKHLGVEWERSITRPAVGKKCLLIDEGDKVVVNVVAHSEFDERAFFADSRFLKGVFKVGDESVAVYIEKT